MRLALSPSAFECAWLGVASKLFASTVTYPSQVVRARMQQRREAETSDANAPLRKRAPSTTALRARSATSSGREGASGLYKGMVPNVLRTLPSSGVTFMVYESVRSFLGEEDEEAAR